MENLLIGSKTKFIYKWATTGDTVRFQVKIMALFDILIWALNPALTQGSFPSS